jgi:hypothetical protein
MKKNTLLYILLIFLIVVNGFFLFNYLGNSALKPEANDSSRNKGPVAFLVKSLDFNEAQMAQLEIINEEHFSAMESTKADELVLKEKLHRLILKDDVLETEVDSILNALGEQQLTHEKMIFYHLRAIRGICTDAQKLKFDNIIKDAKRGGKQRPEMGEHPDMHRDGPPPPPDGRRPDGPPPPRP